MIPARCSLRLLRFFVRLQNMLPKVVIVGRPNVGKSSLLNRMARRKVSIVDPTAGVTRDRIAVPVEIPPQVKGQIARTIEVIDTGGYGIEDSDNLTADVERQIAIGVAEAHLIVFLVDAQTGIVPLDREVARLLRQTNARATILLVANKVDGENQEAAAMEASSLGFGEPLCISAVTGHNYHDFESALMEAIDFDKFDGIDDSLSAGGEPLMHLAIVGKRNAGKSTLVNALAGAERVIVSEVEGTTRDSVDVRFEIEGKPFIAIDTAGVRKRKSVQGDIEYYSLHRSLRSVRRADVVLMMIDATVPTSQVDRQLVNEIVKHYRPCVIVVNKWDLVEDKHTQEEYAEYLDDALKGLNFAPIAFISAKNSEGLKDVVAMASNLYQQARDRVSTGELNRIVEQILCEHRPASKGGKRAKIYYVTQLDVSPPTIVLFVNDPDLFDNTYQRFLLNRFRDELPYAEVPIKLVIRQRKQMAELK